LTDDLGRYRLFWIDPSDYIISATATPDVLEILGSKSNANRSRAPLGFVPTYHTGVTDPRGIEPLAVATGAELEGMDFHLTRNPFIRIRGNVVAAEGQQAEGATVELAPLIRVAVGPLRRQQAKKEGQFEIQGVTPGKYQLSARSSSGARGVAFLDVTTDSVNEVHIPLLASVTLHGQVYLDSTSTLDFQSMQIALVPLDRDLMPPLIAGIAPGGKFALEHVETGAYLVEVGSLPNNAYMAAARIGSENVLQKEVNISGEPSNPLEILLKVDGGVLSGNVNDAEGKPVADAQIVLVPDASRRRPDQYRTAIADERGNFALRGIPPGEYIAYAWDRIEPNAFLNADFMLRYAESGIPVRIASGSNAPLALRPARR
jgi:protocatechuate 3,4-dioxygenase beta subunit